MLSIRLLLFFVLALSCASCVDDPVAPPEDPGHPIDSTGFAILSATTDTLYYGEQAWVTVNQLGTDTNVLRLFVHTVEVTQMTIDGNKLYYTVPRNAPSGKVRLYKNDTLAKNGATLYVLPRHVGEFRTTIQGIESREGYPGEKIVIYASDLPLRRREFDVLLGDKLLEIVKWDTSRIYAVIPEGQGVSTLKLRVFDEVTNVASFTTLAHEGRFLDHGLVTEVHIEASMLLGSTRTEMLQQDSSTVAIFPGVHFYTIASMAGQATVNPEDSVYIRSSEYRDNVKQVVDIALVPSKIRNTVSGRITISFHSNEGQINEGIQTTTIVVKEAAWKQVNGQYYVYARGEEITNKVVSVKHDADFKFENGWYLQTIDEYLGGDSQSVFNLLLLHSN